MLSICIPVYKYQVVGLVENLAKQAIDSQIPFEIIIIDDFSGDVLKQLNKKLAEMPFIIYIELDHNIGRSAIRNHFLNFVKFENLLFLDCDSQIISPDFLRNYIKQIDNYEKVICGGTLYKTVASVKQNNLRQRYGKSSESLSCEIRRQKPYQSFMSNNFVVKKSVLKHIQFEEKLKEYGHEDTLFGYNLMTEKIPVEHINNPVVHNYNETHKEFIDKSLLALNNLHYIVNELKPGNDFVGMIRILRVYSKICRFHFRIPFLIMSVIVQPLIRLIFQSGYSGLLLFNFYKLAYYAQLDNRYILKKSRYKIAQKKK
jgi:glycosyltransferase involved in cell wall biosynthesis